MLSIKLQLDFDNAIFGTPYHSFYTAEASDNFLSPIPVSDWLIFCGRNLILHQRKK